ncbi:hypothetical protein Tco_0990085 [Tanacetum coccineum]|uniref:Uncharacterized protein n=1 Tax=Tanacetum coccineum TaxID=301880 RepID=A0ABQ5EVF7_9ASTR
MGLTSMVSYEAVAKITSLPKGPLGDKDSKGNKTPVDMELINLTVADLSGTGAKYQDELTQESDDEEVFAIGEDMDEDTKAAKEEHYPKLKKYDNILPLTERQLVKYLRKVSRVLFTRITEEQWAHHEEAVVPYADLRASIEGYYEENVDHMDRTNKVINAALNSFDKNKIARGDLLNDLNGVTETLKDIQDTVKEDHVLNKKVIEATKAYTKNFTYLTELLTLIKNFDFQGLKSLVESL